MKFSVKRHEEPAEKTLSHSVVHFSVSQDHPCFGSIDRNQPFWSLCVCSPCWPNESGHIWSGTHIPNDSSSPALDQSRAEPSSQSRSSPSNFFDWDRTDPRCWQTGLRFVRTDPSQCPGLGYTFSVISLLMRKIYLDEAEYTDRSGIISIRLGILGWVVIKSEVELCFR